MKQILIILGVAVIIGIGAFFAFTGSDDNSQNNQPAASLENQTEDSNGNNAQANTNVNDPNNYAVNANIGQTLDATGQSEVQISIDDNIFQTTYLKIDKGTKVTWTNNGQMQHDVTSNSSSPKGGLDSELLGNGGSYSYTFDEAGIYEYFCTPHPTEMRGVITVIE